MSPCRQNPQSPRAFTIRARIIRDPGEDYRDRHKDEGTEKDGEIPDCDSCRDCHDEEAYGGDEGVCGDKIPSVAELVRGKRAGHDDDETEYVGWGSETVGLGGSEGAHLTYYGGEKDGKGGERNVTSEVH